jgi:cell shape-determining protein MreC
MTQSTSDTAELDAAARKLADALLRLELQVETMLDRLDSHRSYEREAEALRLDRARLASDLDSARARERELQRLADEASEALGAAISEVREALGKV